MRSGTLRAAIFGNSGPATLPCTGAPEGANCSTPTSVAVDGNTPTLFKVV